MVLFAAPSPRRSNHTQLYLNKKGELIDGRTGSYWGMSGMARLKIAKDAALPDITPAPGAMPNPERDAEERLDAMRRDIEILIDSGHLDLADKSRGQIIEVLNRHCGAATQHRRNGADKPARDEEHHEGLRELLRQKGLTDEEVERAIEIVRDEAKPNGKDRLPVSGPGGMGGYRSNQSRQAGEETTARGLLAAASASTATRSIAPGDRRSSAPATASSRPSAPGGERRRCKCCTSWGSRSEGGGFQ